MIRNSEKIKACAWCGKKFDANHNWYKQRIPDLCENCRKNKEIVWKFKTIKMKIK